MAIFPSGAYPLVHSPYIHIIKASFPYISFDIYCEAIFTILYSYIVMALLQLNNKID